MLTIIKPTSGSEVRDLKLRQRGQIIAAQDQSLPTKSYFARIVKDGTSPLCRIYHKHEETVDHIISGCPELAKTDSVSSATQ